MLFSSLVFIFIFLPVVLLTYYLVPSKIRNYVLLVFSLIFYSWGGIYYSILLISSILFNYFFAIQLAKNNALKNKWLGVGLTFNISLIVVFKYLDFFIENINALGTIAIPDFNSLHETNILLPLGISFFTFQQMSLLWDIYRDPDKTKIKFVNTALYISFFPQLIAGPIVRYNDIIRQIRNRVEGLNLFSSGIRRFILGLFKKIVLANSCASIADSILDNSLQDLSTPVAWLGIIAYAFQIYFDFAGYSDMAIGLGRMFGFRILENFNYPYISLSIREFWKRWHISLSSWFRDYVYIPLGGNQKGVARTYVNLLIVFLLTGFWHGATWSFVFWGLIHGFFMIIERLGFGRILEKLPKFLAWIYMIATVLIAWVFFRIENFDNALIFVGVLFGKTTANEAILLNYLDRERVIILILAAASSSTAFLRLKNLTLSLFTDQYQIVLRVIYDTILIIMFLYSIMYINSGSYNPFIYFRF